MIDILQVALDAFVTNVLLLMPLDQERKLWKRLGRIVQGSPYQDINTETNCIV